MKINGRQPLTRRQSQVLAVVAAFRAVRGYPPTVRELAAAMYPPLKHRNSAYTTLGQLQAKGYVRWQGGCKGTLVVVGRDVDG